MVTGLTTLQKKVVDLMMEGKLAVKRSIYHTPPIDTYKVGGFGFHGNVFRALVNKEVIEVDYSIDVESDIIETYYKFTSLFFEH